MRRRQPIPEVIANAPALLPGLEVYYEAFCELSTCRQTGMGVGPIPWTAVDSYARRNGFEGEGFDYLLRMVRALDDTFVAYTRAKQERESANGPGRVQP